MKVTVEMQVRMTIDIPNPDNVEELKDNYPEKLHEYTETCIYEMLEKYELDNVEVTDTYIREL